MKIIVGLGNPGEKYSDTRHNIGFSFLDYLQKELAFPDFEENSKLKCQMSKGSFEGQDLILVKPQNFMNLSGESVSLVLSFYKLKPEDITVIHDDLDIVLGTFKRTASSRPAGHNGVKDIIEKLGTQDFERFRIGIGEEKDGTLVCRLNAHDFVLGKMRDDEKQKIESLFPEIKAILIQTKE